MVFPNAWSVRRNLAGEHHQRLSGILGECQTCGIAGCASHNFKTRLPIARIPSHYSTIGLDFAGRWSVHAGKPPGASEPSGGLCPSRHDPAGLVAVTAPAGDRGTHGGSDHEQDEQEDGNQDRGAAAAQGRWGTGQFPQASQSGHRSGHGPSPSAGSAPTPARQTKKGSILALLQRAEGATIGDLIEATRWQVHSVRAALTGLRKEGKELVRDKNDAGVTLYRIAEAR